MGVATFKDNVNINGDLQVNNGSIGGNLDVIGNLNVGGNISFPGQAFLLARKTGETNYSSSNTITYDNVIVKNIVIGIAKRLLHIKPDIIVFFVIGLEQD